METRFGFVFGRAPIADSNNRVASRSGTLPPVSPPFRTLLRPRPRGTDKPVETRTTVMAQCPTPHARIRTAAHRRRPMDRSRCRCPGGDLPHTCTASLLRRTLLASLVIRPARTPVSASSLFVQGSPGAPRPDSGPPRFDVFDPKGLRTRHAARSSRQREVAS